MKRAALVAIGLLCLAPVSRGQDAVDLLITQWLGGGDSPTTNANAKSISDVPTVTVTIPAIKIPAWRNPATKVVVVNGVVFDVTTLNLPSIDVVQLRSLSVADQIKTVTTTVNAWTRLIDYSNTGGAELIGGSWIERWNRRLKKRIAKEGITESVLADCAAFHDAVHAALTKTSHQ